MESHKEAPETSLRGFVLDVIGTLLIVGALVTKYVMGAVAEGDEGFLVSQVWLMPAVAGGILILISARSRRPALRT